MRKIIFIIVFITINIINCFCVPADPKPHTIIQPNGKTLTYYVKGDERLHWCETLDGYTILYNEQGFLEFACKDENGVLQCSGILACNTEDREETELSFLVEISKYLFYSKEQIDKMKNNF